MKAKVLGLFALCAVIAGLGLIWRKREPPKPQDDPAFHHTAAGVHHKIQEFRGVLEDALKRNDLSFIHDHMYYLQGLAVALNEKLDPGKRQKVAGVLQEFKRVTEEIDHFAGRRNQAATEVGLKKLTTVLKELETHFNAGTK